MIIGINYNNDGDNVNDNRYQLQQNKLHNSNNNNDNNYQLQQNKVPNFWTFVYIHIGI
jgi:hypothetical protein